MADQRLANAGKLATKVANRAAKATIPKSSEEATEFDRLWDSLAVRQPLPTLPSVPAIGRTQAPYVRSGF